MKIANITKIGKQKVYDLSVEDVEHYILENGVVTHNTGIYYSADNIFIIGRQQEKDADGLVGYNFIINVEKSRFVREKSKIPVEVSFEGGVSTWSGLMDVALESGHVVKPQNGWYQKKGEEKKYRLNDTYTKEFWLPILNDSTFRDWIKTQFAISNSSLVSEFTDELIIEEYENV